MKTPRRPTTRSPKAATEKALVAGYHFPFPSLGHVEKNGMDYRLVPMNWSTTV